MDSNGVVYSADKSNTAITQIKRNAVNFAFGANTSLTFAGTVTNVGNSTSTGSTRTDTTDFTYAAGSGNGCSFVSNELPSQAPVAGADLLAYLPTSSSTGSSSCNQR